MPKKPRKKYLSKILIKHDGKYAVKKDKPWKPEKVTHSDDDIFANVTMGDLMHGFKNKTNAKRFSNHQFRQRME